MAVFLIILLLAIAALLLVASRRPNVFRVSREIVIAAPAEKIFPHINNLYAWYPWSPWAKLDPQAKNTFEGPAEGVGAKTSWVGNRRVGAGSMLITASRPSEFVQFQLDFLKPMKATNIADFSLNSEAAGTRVTWNMEGKNSFLGKIISLVFNCEKMVGGQFEKGLSRLKEIAER